MSTRRISIFLSILLILMFACGLGVVEETPPIVGDENTGSPTDEAPITTAEPTVISHVLIPGEFPEEPSGSVGDQDSSVTADQNRAPSGDRFTFTRFERPFNSQTMDEYYSAIDILSGQLFEDDLWIYVAITLKSDEASRELIGSYAFEVDLNLDGGGDWLILASNPVSTEWNTNNVEAWFDTDDDVGGDVPTTTDEKPVAGTGYETQIFRSGEGDDSDLAWVRISPSDSNTVQLAVKRDILQGNQRFLVGLWAGQDDLDPALFEFSDTFTHEQAGAAVTELEYFYPIKEVSALDNTCRMAVGFQPTGSEPGLCPLPVVPGQPNEEPPSATCPPQYVYCVNFGNQTVCYCLQP